MLTDDQLTSQLRDAFHGATDDLRYAGRVPAPRNRLALGVPTVASAAVLATLTVVWAANGSDDPAPAPEARPTSSAHRHLVTSRIQVAGFTLQGSGPADDLQLAVGAPLPDDAAPISAPEGAKAWVGTTPSGEHGLWVQAPTRNDGAMFAVLSPTWSLDQLTDLFHHGAPPR